MENNQNSYNNSDELDPVNLIEKAFAFLQHFGKPIFILAFAGLVFGLLRYFTSPKLYSSRLLLHSVVLTNQEEIEMIDNWKDLLGKGEYAALATTMNCEVQLVKKLKKISAEEIQKLYIQNNPNGFAVDVLVTDTSVLDELQQAIIKGLDNSDYVKERIASRIARYQEMIKTIKEEIGKLEITKTTVDSLIKHAGSTSSSMLVDISSLNSQWIGLTEKLISYKDELKFVNAVQVLQSFKKTEKPVSPGFLRSVVFGIFGGAFLGYLISLFLFVKYRMKMRKNLRSV